MRELRRGFCNQIDGIGSAHQETARTMDTAPQPGNLRLTPSMVRTLQPEILDSLPPDHPDAQHSRRDLRWINALMGNHRWFARTLPLLLRPEERALELGAGTGELGARLASRGVTLDGLDLGPRPAACPVAAAWYTGDLRSFAGYGRYAAVIANLLLHHLTADELAALGTALGRTARVIVASEPARRAASQRLFSLVGPLLGANHVTRHDAHVSIAAGFCGDELPHALRLDPTTWTWRCSSRPFGAYRMVAVRRA